jgi:hypothetical protein
VQFEVWLIVGDSLSSVDWSIGTKPFGNSLGSGTASPSSEKLLFNNSSVPLSFCGGSCAITQETFSLSE